MAFSKRKQLANFLSYSLFFLSLCTTLQGEALRWVAYGDLRSNIEPCGCDPSTDLGGVQRLAAELATVRKQAAQTLVFDLGNNISAGSITTKDRFILKALREMVPDAALFNERERALAANDLKLGPSSYVLTNLRSPHVVVKPSIFIRGALVFGFVDGTSSELRPWGKDIEEAMRSEIKARSPQQKVLLFAGKASVLEKIQALSLFDLIISSNPRGDEGAQAIIAEKNNPSLLYRGYRVPVTPFQGLGLLKGGNQKEAAKLLSLSPPAQADLFSTPASAQPTRLPAPEVVWLTKDRGVALDALMKSYNRALAEDFARESSLKSQKIKDNPYVGSEACRACHAKAYEVWRLSRHATAFETLLAKGKSMDGQCVSCHVVNGGKNSEFGFISRDLTPHLVGVQCENCHGPRRDHLKNPVTQGKRVKITPDVCVRCHHDPHSPKFDFGAYWLKIRHP
jgi:hypothetical protein